MKKNILTIIGVLIISTVFGQFTYGPKLGVNAARFSNEKFLPGFQAGGFLTTEFADRIGVQVDFLWTIKGSKTVQGPDSALTTKKTYYRFVDVPVCVYFPISKHVRGFAGPQISVFRKARESEEFKGKITERNLSGVGKMSWCFGFDFNMDSPLVLGVRFVTNKFTPGAAAVDAEGDAAASKLHSVMFNIAYKMDW